MIRRCWKHVAAIAVQTLLCVGVIGLQMARGQELGGAGTVQGTVTDPTGGVMQAVDVKLGNPVSGLTRTATTDAAGKFVFRNLPPNPYHLTSEAQGFKTVERDIDVRSGVPIQADVKLEVGVTESVSVVGHAQDLLERDPTAHTDIDQGLITKLPIETTAGLNQVVMMASPGVVADSNSFFHPVGDHAQTQFSIDNQPVTDQQSRIYSNQISSDAVQSMEVITGVPPAEYGDKSSLVVHIVTKSGLDQRKPTGEFLAGYGTFNTPTVDASVGMGSHKVGNFAAFTGVSTDRYLDTPEFVALHDHGSNSSFFDRVDVKTSTTGALHLNVQAARSNFNIPNTYDEDAAGQAQHQKIMTFNIAPGFSQAIGSDMLFTANAFFRQDHIIYTPSPNPLADFEGSVSQDRKLGNFGAKADLTYTRGAHNVKFGGQFNAFHLQENITLGFTDPTINSPCLNADGTVSGDASLTDPSQCSGDLTANPGFDPALLPFDLTRGGSPFAYNQKATIKTEAVFVQDDIKVGNATFKAGVRLDHYGGLTSDTQAEPRLGASYAFGKGLTIVRASYGRTMETPYNENLLLSSGYGLNNLFGTGSPLKPGIRNEGEFGAQQAIGKWAVVDFGYWIKRTHNGYDFNVLFGTPVVFPIAWDRSKLDGFTGRVNLIERKGFSAFFVMAHTNAIYSPPSSGGILVTPPPGDFRIDHDQKFNSTTNFQYTFAKPVHAWAALSWRYDSGLIPSAVPDWNAALGLTGDQQAAAGMYCGGQFASPGHPITSCSAASYGFTRLVLPLTPANPNAENDVTNPPRVAPRHLFDLAIGSDNLLRPDSKVKLKVRFSVLNLANRDVLYNFLSSFSGTHFVTPRAYTFTAGVGF